MLDDINSSNVPRKRGSIWVVPSGIFARVVVVAGFQNSYIFIKHLRKRFGTASSFNGGSGIFVRFRVVELKMCIRSHRRKCSRDPCRGVEVKLHYLFSDLEDSSLLPSKKVIDNEYHFMRAKDFGTPFLGSRTLLLYVSTCSEYFHSFAITYSLKPICPIGCWLSAYSTLCYRD